MELASLPVGARQKIWRAEKDLGTDIELDSPFTLERLGQSDIPDEAVLIVPENTQSVYCLVQLLDNINFKIKRQFRLRAGAQLKIVSVFFGAPKLEILQEVYLEGAGSVAEQFVLCVGSDTQVTDAVINSDHVIGNSRSHIMLRRILDGHSEQTINSLVQIERGAHGSDGRLDDKAYLLSSGVQNRCIPGLEVDANDVKASHSSSQTRLRSEEVLYATSRGIPAEEARGLLVDGFAARVYEEIADEGIRQEIQLALQSKLRHD